MVATNKDGMIDQDSLEWLQVKKDVGIVNDYAEPETPKEKLLRKMKENPLVPFGAALTITCLTLGLYSFRKGDSKTSQLMMRARVLAQGFTVVALIGGLALSGMKGNPSTNRP